MNLKLSNGNLIYHKPVLTKIANIIYLIMGVLLLLSSLYLYSIVLIEVMEKGRFPIEEDPRFIKGINRDLSLLAFCIILYVGFGWLLFTAIIYSFSRIKLKVGYFLLGVLGMLSGLSVFYLFVFSEVGRWILD